MDNIGDMDRVDVALVDLEIAIKISKVSKKVFVIPNDNRNLLVTEDVFGDVAEVSEVGFVELNSILYGGKNTGNLYEIIKKYDRSIIVCLHGVMAMDFVLALRELGSHAYCLKGGADMLMRRQSK